jgi:hypothetical protein
VKLGEEELFVFATEGIGRVQQGETVGEVTDRSADLVVFVIGLGVLDVVAAHYVMVAVGRVGFPFEEVDFLEKSVEIEVSISCSRDQRVLQRASAEVFKLSD